jgi:hypothetical protein
MDRNTNIPLGGTKIISLPGINLSMKKYLLASLTLIVCLFGLMFINVLVMRGVGFGAGTFVICGLTLGATRYVYRKYRDEENQKNYGTTEISRLLLKSDKKGFEDALKNFDFNQSGIEEFVVANGKEGVSDFIVGIRTRENIKPDYEQIKNVLYKTFFPQIKFVFINMNEMGEESKLIFAGGTEIVGKK